MWVEETKNGKYKFVERYTDFMTGKQKRVSVVMDKNTAQARKAAQKAIDEKIDKAVKACMPVEKTITLAELVEVYLQDQKRTVKQSTYRYSCSFGKTMMEILGSDTLVERISAPYIRQSFLETGKGATTLNEYIAFIKRLLRWGYRNEFVHDVSYLDKLDLFKDKPRRQKIQDKYMESEEAERLLEGMRCANWKLLTRFLILSGLRVGETAALIHDDIDLKSRLIHVRKTYDHSNRVVTLPKSSTSIRDVYIQDELIDVCKEIRLYMLKQRILCGYGASPLFFQGTDGGHLKYFTYCKYLKDNSIRILGRKITVHALRHTHASLLMEQGVDIDTISRRLGHEDSKITREIYLHVTKKLREKDNERIAHVKIM